jgi:uncharacterized protein YndB with AHSA1/START domain
METRTHGLRLKRILEAAPTDVFRAWTEPEAPSRWVRPAEPHEEGWPSFLDQPEKLLARRG